MPSTRASIGRRYSAADLLSGAIEFADRTARDVLVPTAALQSVEPDVTPDDLERLAGETGYSRFPLSDLTGYLHVKDVLTHEARDRAVPAALVRELPAVGADSSLRAVLETMRARGTHVLRVTDGDDGLGVVTDVGIVTMQDVLAELIGASA